MRDSPLLQSLLLAGCLCLLLIPLIRLTGGSQSPQDVPYQSLAQEGDRTGKTPAYVTIYFAHLPEEVTLAAGSEQLWNNHGVQETEYNFTTKVRIVDGIVDLQLSVRWPAATPHSVVEVVVAVDGFDTFRQTAWGEGELTEFLSFKVL